MIAGVCRMCGCTHDQGCVVDPDGNVVELDAGETLPPGYSICTWIEPDLCSACVQPPAPAPLLYDAYGNPLRGAP
jgi:hypothetical protein